MDLDKLPEVVTEIEQNIDFLLHLPDHALHGKHRSELLQAHLWLARIHQIAGDRDAAERTLRAGVQLADKFVAGRPDASGWELAGLKLRVMLGNVLAATGELDAAVAALRPATAMADHLESLAPDGDLWGEDVDDPYYVLGLVLMQRGDLSPEALPVHERAYDYAERRYREAPGGADQGWLLFQLCLYRVALLQALGERARGGEAIARAIFLADHLPVENELHAKLKGMAVWTEAADKEAQ
jgi:tetratricopeptide (TPR) repeat protein